ncbi:MAG: hypothetical protein II298_01730, partial [Bacteroidales bacterium]|nr:hypothetical protein [Bacteroidales bacterium]
MPKKSLFLPNFSLFFSIFSLIFSKKNLDLIFSILDLEISIPDLENSKRAFGKITLDFAQFFVKIFAKKSVLKFWQNKSD